MENDQYIVNSVDADHGVSFSYRIWDHDFTHTLFMDLYTADAITAASAAYISSEKDRLEDQLTTQPSLPSEIEDLIGSTGSV